MSMPEDLFQPVTTPAADWSAAANWSQGIVPGAGMAATIAGTTAMIDPGVVIATALTLQDAGIEGNGGAVALGAAASLAVIGTGWIDSADSLVNQGSIALDGGSHLTIVVDLGAISGLTGAAPPSFANQGLITLAPASTLAIDGTEFENAGTVSLTAATLDVNGGAMSGHGTIVLAQDSTAWFGDGVASQSFDFVPGGGTVSFADPLLGAGITLTGFGASDAIVLPDLADATLSQADGTATITNGQGAIEGSFAYTGAPHFAVRTFGTGSVIVAVADALPYNPPCFARGTGILTPSGYRPVEHLAAGDRVVTADGSVTTLIWTGTRTVNFLGDLAGHPSPRHVQPIRIATGALAPGVPRRTLRVSPDHAIMLDGVLIPAKLLVNDATILQETGCPAVTYHHLELARHDVLLAEAAPCESYLDTGNRAGFEGASTCTIRPKRWDRDACALLVTSGERLHRVRASLHDRALSLGFVARPDPRIELWVDRTRIAPNRAGRHTLPTNHRGTAVLRSAGFTPACFDPASEDRRQLGIALTSLRAGRHAYRPDDLALAGFHPRAAGDPALWTDGAGTIRLPQGARSITLDIAAPPLTWQHAGTSQGNPSLR